MHVCMFVCVYVCMYVYYPHFSALPRRSRGILAPGVQGLEGCVKLEPRDLLPPFRFHCPRVHGILTEVIKKERVRAIISFKERVKSEGYYIAIYIHTGQSDQEQRVREVMKPRECVVYWNSIP